MKNVSIRKLTVLLTMVLAPIVACADSFPLVKLEAVSNKVVALRVAAGNSETVNLALKDADGHILYQETVTNTHGIMKRFNLQNIAPGDYSIELENSRNIEILSLEVTKSGIQVNQLKFEEIHKPFFKLRTDKHVDINILNLHQFATKVFISNNSGDILFEEHLGNQVELKKRYDLSSLPKGTYFVNVRQEERTFSYSINL